MYNNIQARLFIEIFSFFQLFAFVPQTEWSISNVKSDRILIGVGWCTWATM